jgi:hypothetical protein
VERRTVYLHYLSEKNRDFIAIRFAMQKELSLAVSKIPGARWNKDNKCWMLPMGRDSYKAIVNVCQGQASIDDSGLRKYLEERKSGRQPAPEVFKAEAGGGHAVGMAEHGYIGNAGDGIDRVNIPELRSMLEQLTLKAYSKSTVKTYRNEFAAFLRAIANLSVLPAMQIADYCN